MITNSGTTRGRFKNTFNILKLFHLKAIKTVRQLLDAVQMKIKLKNGQRLKFYCILKKELSLLKLR